MDIGELLIVDDEAPALRFLVIGGYAVNAHGYSRTTIDIDFLVRREDRALWMARLCQRGCAILREADVFMQFTQERGTAIDLMLVRDETFEQFWTASEERTAMGVLVRVPSLDHLIALKLHALKQQLAQRTFKDADDVESLVRVNKLDLQSPHYEQLFLKYGTREITKHSSGSPVSDGVLEPNFDFELPDWNAKDRTPPRLTMDKYILWIESLRKRGVLKSPTAEERLAEKVDVEFVL